MLEVEAKAPCPDPAALLRRLGPPEATRRQVDVYYAHPSRDFGVADEALRLRDEDGRVELTWKGPKRGARAKTREEATTAVADRAAAERILAGLGFAPAGRVAKTRRLWRRGPFEVALDEVEGLGAFVEVEAKEPGDVAALETAALALLVDLGCGPPTRTSYLEMLRADSPPR